MTAPGRLHGYDTGADASRLTVFWPRGTPHVGAPPRPPFPAEDGLGTRRLSYAGPATASRPSAPAATWPRPPTTSRPRPTPWASRLGFPRFGRSWGHSGGGPHALACAALVPRRVLAVVAVAAPAPFGAEGLDWYAGRCPSGTASLRAAAERPAAKERHEARAEYDPEMFTPADHAALAGEWSWYGEVVSPAVASGPGGPIADDLAYVAPWGCDPAWITAPVLVLHGGRDRVAPSAHGRCLADRCPAVEL